MRRLIAALVVAATLLAGGVNIAGAAKTNARLRERVAALETLVTSLETHNAVQDQHIQAANGEIRDLSAAVAALQTIDPAQVQTRDCAPGEDATWESVFISPGGLPNLVRLSC